MYTRTQRVVPPYRPHVVETVSDDISGLQPSREAVLGREVAGEELCQSSIAGDRPTTGGPTQLL